MDSIDIVYNKINRCMERDVKSLAAVWMKCQPCETVIFLIEWANHSLISRDLDMYQMFCTNFMLSFYVLNW